MTKSRGFRFGYSYFGKMLQTCKQMHIRHICLTVFLSNFAFWGNRAKYNGQREQLTNVAARVISIQGMPSTKFLASLDISRGSRCKVQQESSRVFKLVKGINSSSFKYRPYKIEQTKI